MLQKLDDIGALKDKKTEYDKVVVKVVQYTRRNIFNSSSNVVTLQAHTHILIKLSFQKETQKLTSNELEDEVT